MAIAGPTLLKRVAELVEHSMWRPESAATACAELLQDAVGASNGYLIVAARREGRFPARADPQLGFRVALHLRRHPLERRAAELVRTIVREQSYVGDRGVAGLVKRSARISVERADHLRAPGSFRHPHLSALHEALGLRDQLVGMMPLGPDARIMVSVDRSRRERTFGRRERERLLALLPALGVPFARVAAAHGVFDGRALLSPREAEVFRELLTSRSEKQIAAFLGLTERSTHQVVTAVYRKLVVSGRVELLHRWRLPGDIRSPDAGSRRRSS